MVNTRFVCFCCSPLLYYIYRRHSYNILIHTKQEFASYMYVCSGEWIELPAPQWIELRLVCCWWLPNEMHRRHPYSPLKHINHRRVKILVSRSLLPISLYVVRVDWISYTSVVMLVLCLLLYSLLNKMHRRHADSPCYIWFIKTLKP